MSGPSPAKSVFVDSDAATWNLSPPLLAEAIADGIRRGEKPKAVILVHLYGQSADIDPIAAICAEHDIPLIEDAAEALGATYWGRRADDGGGGLAHGTRGTHGRIFDRRGRRDRWAEGGS